MSYREQLKNLKVQQNRHNRNIRDRENMFGSIMTDEARAFNSVQDNMINTYYEREIGRLEKLAQKELESEIVQNVLQCINQDVKFDTSRFEKEMKSIMKDLGFK